MQFTFKQKLFLTIIFIISLLPLFAVHYGTRGVNELYGWAVNPLITIPSILIYFVGLWAPLPGKQLGKILGLLGTIGMVTAGVVGFIFMSRPDGLFDLSYALKHATAFFWLSLMVSALMVFIYGCVLSLTKTRKRR